MQFELNNRNFLYLKQFYLVNLLVFFMFIAGNNNYKQKNSLL